MRISQVVATLPLTSFVFVYGNGQIAFLSLSESAKHGRISINIISIFFTLQIHIAVAPNIAGLRILWFVSGPFASSCLATGG